MPTSGFKAVGLYSSLLAAKINGENNLWTLLSIQMTYEHLKSKVTGSWCLGGGEVAKTYLGRKYTV